MPLPFLLILIVLLLVAILRDKKRQAWSLSFVSILLFLVISTPFVPDYLLSKTERVFSQFDVDQSIDKIVILGCGHVNDPMLPITSQLYPCSRARLVEAMRIYQLNKASQIITSGALARDIVSNALMNKRFLIAMGIDPINIMAIEQSRDTEEEATNIKKHLDEKKFALVTSASHMQRAMKLFQDQGLNPIPAPTEHLVRHSSSTTWRYFLPHSNNISKMERWWHETLGRTWIKLKAHLA